MKKKFMIEEELRQLVQKLMVNKYNVESDLDISVQSTRQEVDGDLTVVLFPLLKVARTNPAQLGQIIGEELIENCDAVKSFDVVKGFLNLKLTDSFWLQTIEKAGLDPDYGKWEAKGEKTIVEFSSPNTNKPLHLGHIRNILLGSSLANILEYNGHEVVRTQVINDRGIAICKSMVIQRDYMDGESPQTVGKKGDHYVGDLYVRFETEFKSEYEKWQATEAAEEVYDSLSKEGEARDVFFKRWKNEYFNQFSSLGKEAKNMLLAWEAGEPRVIKLWERMNSWVYEGFEQTYGRLDVEFDLNYYESKTYSLGNTYVDEGLKAGIFEKKQDGSIWVDLTERGLDEKILRRADGTSLYITQDIGTAQKRFEDFGQDRMIYVVGNEQEYHFQVLFEVLDLLEASYANQCYHLSYGMVDLPHGKMKSREGNVVDADDLMNEVVQQAEENAKERGDLSDLTQAERKVIYERVGLAALKFFIIKVNPQKRMVFNPEASLDLQGQTGPYIQNAYVRIQSIFRKVGCPDVNQIPSAYDWAPQERAVVAALRQFPLVIAEAAERYDPSHVAHYAYELAKLFHKFYHDISIQRAESPAVRHVRLLLCQAVAAVIEKSMGLLGMEMPQRM